MKQYFKNRLSTQSKANKIYADPTLNKSSDEFEVNNWILSEFVIEEILPVTGIHPFPLSELLLMTGATCRFKPHLIFEWGTHIGKSARIFYETTRAFNINAKIYSIDLPDNVDHVEHPQEKRGMLVEGLNRVELIQGDGLNDSLRVIQKNKTNSSKRILFFIDGDHSYESVKREFGSLIREVPNAAFLLHDTFYQSSNSGYNIGPHKAIEEVLSNQKKKYKLVNTNTGLPGMTLVYPETMAKL